MLVIVVLIVLQQQQQQQYPTHQRNRINIQIASAIMESSNLPYNPNDITSTNSYQNADIITLTIGGMTCSSCVNSIENALHNIDGVEQAKVNMLTEKATIQYNASKTNVEHLIETVESIGYDAQIDKQSHGSNEMQLQFDITGMTCSPAEIDT